MASKTGIGYSPLTQRVYLGKQNLEKGIWVGVKSDITNKFISVSLEFYEENTIREIITRSTGSANLVINIKKDKASIEKAIKTLTKRLDSF